MCMCGGKGAGSVPRTGSLKWRDDNTVPGAFPQGVVRALHPADPTRHEPASVPGLKHHPETDVEQTLAVACHLTAPGIELLHPVHNRCYGDAAAHRNLQPAPQRNGEADVVHAHAVAEIYAGAPETGARLDEERRAAEWIVLGDEHEARERFRAP